MKRLITSALLLACGLVGDATPAQTSREIIDRATGLAAGGQTPQALDTFEAALLANPDDLHLGAEYRQVTIQAGTYDRSLAFFEKLVADHPESANARLNFAFAHVDKVPVEGAITGVILANRALTQFTAALEIEESWLGLYSRGNSYMYWPTIFGRTPKGIADLEKAIAMSVANPKPFHGRAYAALGDGYWRLGDRDKMREIWKKGAELFPDDAPLAKRLSLEGEALDAHLDQLFDAANRVDTHLRELIAEGPK